MQFYWRKLPLHLYFSYFLAGAPFRKPFYPNRRDDNIGPQLPDQIKNRFVQQNGGKLAESADYQTAQASTVLPVEIATQVPAFAQYPRKDAFSHNMCVTHYIRTHTHTRTKVCFLSGN